MQAVVDDKKQDIHYLIKERYRYLIDILKGKGGHTFWNTQPIMKLTKAIHKKGQIKQFKKEEISTVYTPLPKGFHWADFDVKDDSQIDEICNFLSDFYVEDESGQFRLDYSKEKLKWACCTPGYIKDLHFCVRSEENDKIMATIVGIPKKVVINGETVKTAEVNFLAVHRSLRGKRLAQVMIIEMMRRKRLHGLMTAFYTAHHAQPTPFCTVGFYNRFLNPKKLIDIGYTVLPPKVKLQAFEHRFKLPEHKSINIVGDLRLMQKKDASAVLKLYNQSNAERKFKYKMS